MTKVLIVTLPDLPGHAVSCAWNDVATENIACYVVPAHEIDMRNIPANPGDPYRVALNERVTSNLVSALREMIMRAQE
jgi:hypothetical protein